MTNTNGDRVRLALSDLVTIALFLIGQLVVVAGVGVAMWTRLAVVETELSHQSKAIGQVQLDLRDLQLQLRTRGNS